MTPEQKNLTREQKQAWLDSLRAKVRELAELDRKHPGKFTGTLRAKRLQANELARHLESC